MNDDLNENTQNVPAPDSADAAVPEQGLDNATQALVDALRVVFRFLKLIMVVLVVLFLCSGIYKVEPNQTGLRLHFGEVTGGLAKPGLHLAWPEPIDRTLVVPTEMLRSANVTFWYVVSAQEQLLGEKPGGGQGLEPGKEHFVITGDANILHVDMTVKYRISNAETFVESFIGADNFERVSDMQNPPEKPFVESLAQSAVLTASGQVTVDSLMTKDKTAFAEVVERHLRDALMDLECGLELDSVLIGKIEPPRQVVKYFNMVRDATELKRSEIRQAQGDATKLLTETAGQGYEELTEAIEAEQKLLGQDTAEAQAASQRVSALLDEAGGTVQEILSEAKIYRTRLVEQAKADAAYLKELLPRYEENPEVVTTRLLLTTLEDLLTQVKKWYVPQGASEVRYNIDADTREFTEKAERVGPQGR